MSLEDTLVFVACSAVGFDGACDAAKGWVEDLTREGVFGPGLMAGVQLAHSEKPG